LRPHHVGMQPAPIEHAALAAPARVPERAGPRRSPTRPAPASASAFARDSRGANEAVPPRVATRLRVLSVSAVCVGSLERFGCESAVWKSAPSRALRVQLEIEPRQLNDLGHGQAASALRSRCGPISSQSWRTMPIAADTAFNRGWESREQRLRDAASSSRTLADEPRSGRHCGRFP
jgi:hypothetical protein